MIDIEKDSGLKLGDTIRHFEARRKMIRSQIEARGVTDRHVLRALLEVPRHRFVSEKIESSAYEDSPLPIGENQTISQPFIVAYMTAALELDGHESVLEVGTGSGYQAAILSEIVDTVFTIEINENLTIEAALRFKKMGLNNVHLRYGDGYLGWQDKAPFDGIIVTAAPTHIPQALIDQLADNGKLVIPVGDAEQELIVVTKQANGAIVKESRIPVRFVPMLRETESKD